MTRKIAVPTFVLGSFLLLLGLGFLRELKEDSFPTQSGITLGILAPFSGPLAEYGTAIRNGIQMAKEEHPQALNGLKVLYEDTRYDPARAVSAFRRLANAKIDLAYNFGGPTSEALSPIAESSRIPLLVWTADPKVSQKRNYVIRFINSASDFGVSLNSHLRAKRYRRIAIVKSENQYINSLLEGLKASLDENQKLTIVDTYMPGDRDFRSTVSKLSSKRFDALGVYLMSGQVSQFYRQLKQQNVSLPSFGTDFFESISEVRDAGESIRGAVFSNHGVSETFRRRYVERFGDDYQIPNAGLAYDLVNLLHRSFCTGEEQWKADGILAKLRDPAQKKGVSGLFQYREGSNGDQHFAFPIMLRQVQQVGDLAIVRADSKRLIEE